MVSVLVTSNLLVQVETFNDIVDPNGKSTDEDSYKALTALGILSAIQALVKATFNQTQVSRTQLAGVEACLVSVVTLYHIFVCRSCCRWRRL